jgi:hypothetical protein
MPHYEFINNQLKTKSMNVSAYTNTGLQDGKWVKVKGKGKFRHRTGHKGPEGEYSSTLSLTSALDGLGG